MIFWSGTSFSPSLLVKKETPSGRNSPAEEGAHPHPCDAASNTIRAIPLLMVSLFSKIACEVDFHTTRLTNLSTGSHWESVSCLNVKRDVKSELEL